MRLRRGAQLGAVALVLLATSSLAVGGAAGQPARPVVVVDTYTAVSVEVTLDPGITWAGGPRIDGTVLVRDLRDASSLKRQRSPLDFSIYLITSGSATLAPELIGCAASSGRPCAVRNVEPGRDGTVRFSLIPPAFGAGAGEVVAMVDGARFTIDDPVEPQNDWNAASATDSASYEVRQPSFELSTTVAAQGATAIVGGSDLPPDATIELDWDIGIASAVTVRTDGDDEAWWSLPIDPHDTLGLRHLIVKSADFTPNVADENLLVVPSTARPPTRNLFQR